MDLVVIGGSDAGISAGLRARELDPSCRVTLIVADAYPNFSICGIPYFISGDVVDWHDLAHRTHADLVAAGLQLRLDTRALSIDPHRHELNVATADGAQETVSYDALVVGTGAVPLVPPIRGLTGPDALGPDDGVHLLHTMGETFALATDITQRQPTTALIVGAGYIGVEMAEALTARGIHVTQVDPLPEVLPTVDADLGALVRGELVRHGVSVSTTTTVSRISRRDGRAPRRRPDSRRADLVGRRPRPGRHRRHPRHRPAHRGRGTDRPPRRADRRRVDGHRSARRVGGRGLRRHPPPPARRHLPPVGDHRAQARARRGSQRRRRHRTVRRKPGTQVVKVFDLVDRADRSTRPRGRPPRPRSGNDHLQPE